MNWISVLDVLWCGLAIGVIAYTLTMAKIFAGFREWIRKRNAWLGKLLSCPYCTGHWLAFGATAVYRPQLVSVDDWGQWAFSFAVAAFVMILVGAVSTRIVSWALSDLRYPEDTIAKARNAPANNMERSNAADNTSGRQHRFGRSAV